MKPNDGIVITRKRAIVIFLIIFPSLCICSFGQQGILDSTFTFKSGVVTTKEALKTISKNSGYSFTYNSRLVDAGRTLNFNFNKTRLSVILDSILGTNRLIYSIIDKYIIISRPYTEQNSDSTSHSGIIEIKGIITDQETSEPLPFATIGLKNSGRGTISNNNGEFYLKIPSDLGIDTLSVSYIGYEKLEIPVFKTIGDNIELKIKKEYISIPEIIIRNQIPQEIIIKAISSIPRNYGKAPAILTGFYREGVMKKNELQNYSEAVLQIFKPPYSGSLQSDQIKIYKSRKMDNTSLRDTLSVRLKAGLSTTLLLDCVQNSVDFLTREGPMNYVYRMTDIVTYDDESAYVIEFEKHEGLIQPPYKGTIYINTSDYAILNIEFELNESAISQMKESFISNSSPGIQTRPLSVKYSVSYRKINDRYFLNHVRGDLIFVSNQRKKLFNSQFKVFFELAITDNKLDNIARFDKEELAPIYSIFSKTITSYDHQFWEDQDFIPPEENLLRAINNIKVRLQEFSK
jgi:hypothetical protein